MTHAANQKVQSSLCNRKKETTNKKKGKSKANKTQGAKMELQISVENKKQKRQNKVSL